MRDISALALLAACCGLLNSKTADAVTATKAIFDYRTGNDFESDNNCENSYELKTRYLQIEAFDYNQTPDLTVTWRQIGDECGNPISDGFESTMSWAEGDITTDRLQMDMYICVPWGDYELVIECKSTNGGNDMERIAWEIEYGPDEYHIWDTLNTPFFREEPASDYAPIPNGDGNLQTFTFPLEGSEAYYSVMYSGPFPPLHCPNQYPDGVEYVGCYDAGLFGTAEGPEGTENDADPAEPYRMFDGIDDDGVDADRVMTLEKCANTCQAQGTKYFGLESAVKCLCGDELDDSLYPDEFGVSVCGIDYSDSVDVPEYKFLCSGEARVLCGTDDHISVYSLDGSGPAPTPVSGGEYYTSLGCVQDDKNDRVLSFGPESQSSMSAEICLAICSGEDSSYTHFGTQYGQECWCGEDVGSTTASSACTMSCAGNADETCGGVDALSLYTIDDAPQPTPAPVPSTSEGDFAYVGCVVDDQNNRVMEGPEKADAMSAEVCLDICADKYPSYGFFGTQYSNECWCADELESTTSSTACTMTCAGTTDGEICGGFDALSVYEIGASEPYTFEGCAEDDQQNRVMSVGPQKESSMSAEICYEFCVGEDSSYKYFGTQYSNECWCSASFSASTDADVCTMACAGNAGEICGGFDAISVYSIN